MFGASNKEFEILDLLKSGNRLYGLEMVNASDTLKRGSIYVFLGRMVEKGWLESAQEKEETVPGLPRRLYWITGKGKAVYDRAVATRQQFNAWDIEGAGV
ncbi:hypothetical protein CO657_03545 [Rhizobium acidisoli]|uniref:Transcription regulator PadR N-terminal domain-containing protein n=1 Tax=Rhizobium acidisoli TaxID=1538158 RepID=A0AAE5TV08_9HYPH|nr:helix-turn-helix transcriptional regulator [Rhizobium acidisoli]KPH10227.1 hypothetical protein AOG23_01520 [Rhizobium acidisoli]QAS77220.1 hypothetical protein CO657_03545 [Rhizobium acidisoli]